MGLPVYTLMGLVVTCLSASADQLKQKPQTLNFSPTKNAQLDEVKPDVVPIFLYDREDSLDGDYNFKYETGNGIFAEERGVMMNKGTENEASSVVGTYRYTSPEGIPIEVTYTAGVDGFKAYGPHLPVSPAAYAPKSLPHSNAGPTAFARPQYRTDNSEPAASYPQPTPAAGGTDAAAAQAQPSATGSGESREQPVRTPAADYYPATQQQQKQTVTYPPQQQASAPPPQKPLQFVQEPAKPAAAPTAQPQAVQNSLVARPADYYSPPPQQFQQPPVSYPRPQAFIAPTPQPQPQQSYPTPQQAYPTPQPQQAYPSPQQAYPTPQPQQAYPSPQQAYPSPQPQQAYPLPQPQQAYPSPQPQQAYPTAQPQQAYPSPQPTSRVPAAVQRAVRPVNPGAQQQWFNAGYGPQQRPAPARQVAVEPQQLVRYVPQSRYYQMPPPYAQRTGPEPPRY